MKRILELYIYGHWHIALCALFLYLGSAFALHQEPQAWLGIHIFFATLFVYTMHRHVSAPKMAFNDVRRYEFISRRKLYVLVILVSSFILTAYSFFHLGSIIQILLIISGIISLGYILPLIFQKRLRDIGMAKIFLISTVWAIIPLMNSISTTDTAINVILFLEHFFFIFALTIPFDVRDQSIDQHSRVSNLANHLGEKWTKIIMMACALSATLMALILKYLNIYNPQELVIMIFFYVLLIYLIYDLKKKRSWYYYLLILDGMILLKGALYLII